MFRWSFRSTARHGRIGERSRLSLRGHAWLAALILLVGGFGVAAPTTLPSESPAAAVPLDPALKPYAPQSKLRGRLRTVGSDTMDRLLQQWERRLKQSHPDLRLFHEGKGSNTAMPNLIEGLSDFGPMSRQLKEDEVTGFQSKFGYRPTQVRVAVDALAVYVHPDNPIAVRGLGLDELDAIFSAARQRGHSQSIETWGQLGLTGEWADAPIRVFSRNTASGTYLFFRDEALRGGDFKPTNKELVGSAAVVEAVAADRFAIGYSGIGYKTDGVATVPLIRAAGESAVPPLPEFAYDGVYPLARYLYLTLNYRPGETLSPMAREFLLFVYSRDGQQLVAEEGFFPVSAEIAEQELTRVGLP